MNSLVDYRIPLRNERHVIIKEFRKPPTVPNQRIKLPTLQSPIARWLSDRPRRRMLLGGALIFALTLIVYWPSMRGEFILDDDVLLTKSELITAPDGLYQFWFTTKPLDYWPVTNSTLWLEWRMWGTETTGYHVVNVLLHIASSLLVWTILRRLSIPGSYLAALLFAVHPLNVQSVAWISQCKNALSMFFFLLSILWWLRADEGRPIAEAIAETAPSGERYQSIAWYWLSVAAFLAAMLAKGSVAVLPLILLTIAWWRRDRIVRRDLMRTVPFFAVAVALTAVNIWFQTHGAAVIVRDVNGWQRLAGAGAVVWFYIYKAIVPINLVFIYPQWNIDVGQIQWWLPDVGIIAVTALLIWQRRNPWARPILFAWVLTCISLAPVMGFTDVGFMKFSLVADHYAHIALIPTMALIAAGCVIWYQRTNQP